MLNHIKENILFMVIIVIFFSARSLFFGLGKRSLWDPDEGRYAEIPREMIEMHDYITPHLNYIKYFEKPPLYYWLNVISFKLFGQNEFAARFFSAIFGIAGVLLTFFLGFMIFDSLTGFISAIILLISPLYFILSRINIIDPAVSFFITATLFSFYLWFLKNEKGNKKNLWLWAFYISMALAVLTKGLIGVVLPLLVIGIWIILTRKFSIIKDMKLIHGTIIFLAITSPWFIMVSLKNHEFLWFFFIHEHFLRYLSSIHRRYEPFWFFLVVIIEGFLPWTFFLPSSLILLFSSKKRETKYISEGNLFLLLWITLILGFFSLSHSKLAPYILPIFPPIAIIVGSFFKQYIKNEKEYIFIHFSWSLYLLIILGIIIAVTPIAIIIFYPTFEYASILMKPIFYILGLTFLTMAILAFLFHKKNQRVATVTTLVLGVALFLGISTNFIPKEIDNEKSTKSLAKIMSSFLAKDDIVAMYRSFDPSLGFYLKRRIALVNKVGELRFGRKHGNLNDENWFYKADNFKKLWNSQKRVYCVMPKKKYQKFRKEGFKKINFITQVDDHILISNIIRKYK
ncbi:MAG: glycosyltransferase family 39 protein [Deltaproteobacteria bacterium]|nr:glycosyltransferase family 39 protein [Deltaproteobacteria bacterium]